MKILLALSLLVYLFSEELEVKLKKVRVEKREQNKKKQLIDFWINERENL